MEPWNQYLHVGFCNVGTGEWFHERSKEFPFRGVFVRETYLE
jgi:hypothetical protein